MQDLLYIKAYQSSFFNSYSDWVFSFCLYCCMYSVNSTLNLKYNLSKYFSFKHLNVNINGQLHLRFELQTRMVLDMGHKNDRTAFNVPIKL